MAGKVPKTSNKKPVTLETIKEQLDRQDKKMTKSLWWSYAATVGLPIFLVGLVGDGEGLKWLEIRVVLPYIG
jgi:hypothetical protein